ncbi:MAG: L-seryl-tRNA(Sec) selenium transferase [Gemmatimonadota bacterium]
MSGGDDARRILPSVDGLLRESRVASWIEVWGREPVKRELRRAVATARELASRGEATSAERILAAARRGLEEAARTSPAPTLNGTGVVLHTNLGRAPLPEAAVRAAAEVGGGYAALEYDLVRGRRGDRYAHCVHLLAELTGSEDALVVNNNAAAVALAVNELARGRDVVVSRGELVEIGGSFRIPEIVERSGAVLRAIGTTNRTRLRDYRAAMGEQTGAILKVHPSNYRIEGFVESVPLAALVELGREMGTPVIHDLGSGLLVPPEAVGLPPEPGPRTSVEAGADVVTWSGDKLLGGPQAGILHGRASAIGRLRENPLLRAFRVDGPTLAALEATLRLHRDPVVAVRDVPVLRMLAAPADEIEARARRALAFLGEDLRGQVKVERMRGLVGGGSFPGVTLDSAGWAVLEPDPDRIERRCREGVPPLVGRIEDGGFRVDFRTLLPGQEREAARVLEEAMRRRVGEEETGP